MKLNQMNKKKYTGPTKAGIYKSDKESWVRVVAPWNQDFLDELKDTFQPSFRRWDPDAKHWLINDIYLEDIILLCKKYFDDVETDLTSESSDSNPFIAVLDLIPIQDLDKIYKTLAFAVHPDRGGSDKSMKLLNEAYEKRKA